MKGKIMTEEVHEITDAPSKKRKFEIDKKKAAIVGACSVLAVGVLVATRRATKRTDSDEESPETETTQD